MIVKYLKTAANKIHKIFQDTMNNFLVFCSIWRIHKMSYWDYLTWVGLLFMYFMLCI